MNARRRKGNRRSLAFMGPKDYSGRGKKFYSSVMRQLSELPRGELYDLDKCQGLM